MEPTDLSALIDDSLLLLEREMAKYRIRVEKHLEPMRRRPWPTATRFSKCS